MAKSTPINPLLAGAIGVGIGAALWGMISAPKDALLWTGSDAETQAIKDLLAKAGIDSSVQNMMSRFAVLVKSSDLTRSVALTSAAGYLR